jgi:hypothetical protein
MHRYAFAVPELPGKDARSIPAFAKTQPDQLRESRRRAGITMERVYRMPTPMGVFTIGYIESAATFAETTALFAKSDLPFDREFLRRLADVHGFDATKPPPGPGPELIAEWWDPEVKERGRGLAFVAPLRPGKTAEGRAFARAATVERVKEMTASRRALGINGEVIVLNPTPQGDFVCVYLEGRDPVAGNRGFAASKSPFDVWFKAECRKIFPDAMDFDQPLPPIEQIHDWRA